MRPPFCDHCGDLFREASWKCLQCPVFELCSHCYQDKDILRFHDSNFPTQHSFTEAAFAANTQTQGNCDGCSATLSRSYYRCLACPDYDLCDECFGESAHQHDFMKVSNPEDIYWHGIPPRYMNVLLLGTEARCACCRDSLGSGPQFMCIGNDCEYRERPICGNCDASPNGLHEPSHVVIKMQLPTALYARDYSEIFHPAFCGICRNVITGERHKCIDCYDFDLCNRCLVNSRDQHDKAHRFLEVDRHCDSCGTAITGTSYSCATCAPALEYHLCSACSNDDTNTHVINHEMIVIFRASTSLRPAPYPVEPILRHFGVTCKICGLQDMEGTRMRCLDCPNFDTCLACFENTPMTHPTHRFIMVAFPDDIKRGSILQAVRHPAGCDVCGNDISGTRFKCVHPSCKDFDLCQDCEALPFSIHPTSHLLLKIKQALDNSSVRDLTVIARAAIYGAPADNKHEPLALISPTSTTFSADPPTSSTGMEIVPRLEALQLAGFHEVQNFVGGHHHTLILEQQAKYKLVSAIVQAVGTGVIAIPKGRTGIITWLYRLPTLWTAIQHYHQAKKARQRAGFENALPIRIADAIPMAAVALASSFGLKIGPNPGSYAEITGSNSPRSIGNFLGGFMDAVQLNLAAHGRVINSEVARGVNLIQNIPEDASGPDANQIAVNSLNAFYRANGPNSSFADHMATAVGRIEEVGDITHDDLYTEETGKRLGNVATGLVMDDVIGKLAAERGDKSYSIPGAFRP